MDADLELIGARCQVCHRQDFLPFKCVACSKDFCVTHATMEAHACPVAKVSTMLPVKTYHHQDRQQVVPEVTLPQVVKTPVPQEARDNLAILKKMGRSFQLRGKSSATIRDLRALGQLKKEAKGDVNIPESSRLYVCITKSNTEMKIPYWIHRDWTVGRTLDSIASKLGLVNENARTHDEARRLHLSANGLVLEPSQKIVQLVKNRDEITIFRGPRTKVS